jgi:vacuolar-type H+-ATPase subunit H
LSDRIYEAEKEAREVYETTTAENEDMKYHQICQIIKQIQEYRDEVCDLFEEFKKKINERSL